MLAQDRIALSTSLQSAALEIRERELNLFHDSLGSVGTQAALFAGFAFSALVEFEIPEELTGGWVTWVFTLLCVITLILNLNCVVHAISVSVWGPGLALRGETPEDMIKAVNCMRDERIKAFTLGFFGTMSIQMSAASMAWTSLDDTLSAVVTFMIACSICCTVYNMLRVKKMFTGETEIKREDEMFHSDGLAPINPEGSVISAGDMDSGKGKPGLFSAASRRFKGDGVGEPLSFETVGTSQAAAAIGPVICSHSGYMSATGGAGADAADLYTGRIFFVLFEAELWMYASKKDWKARTAPLDEVPLPLGKYRLIADVKSSEKESPGMFGMRKPLRKLVTGDEDVRVRDYMSDAKLRKAMQPAASSNRPSTPGAPGSSAKDASQELVIAGSQNSSDNGDTVLGDDDAAPTQGGAQGPGQALKFQLVHEDSVIAATQPTGIIELRAESSEEKAGWLAAFQPVAASSK